MPEYEATEKSLRCYRCGCGLEKLSLPLSRRDLCPECSVELHVCRMCRHYAPTAPDGCREEDAIAVTNKAIANFCDYFGPDPDAFDGREKQAESAARNALDALFGDQGQSDQADAGKPADDQMLNKAEDLFRK
jgi:hypothetical protein